MHVCNPSILPQRPEEPSKSDVSLDSKGGLKLLQPENLAHFLETETTEHRHVSLRACVLAETGCKSGGLSIAGACCFCQLWGRDMEMHLLFPICIANGEKAGVGH